jgi:hypothetical protein
LVSQERVYSVREVLKEMQAAGTDHPDTQWAVQNKDLFREPSVAEALFLREIYSVDHFQQGLERKKLLKGGPFADPFVIASAKVHNCTVVTEEKEKANGTKIPNICKHFGVMCTNLEGFMELEDWEF